MTTLPKTATNGLAKGILADCLHKTSKIDFWKWIKHDLAIQIF